MISMEHIEFAQGLVQRIWKNEFDAESDESNIQYLKVRME